MEVKPLPARPRLEQYNEEANDLLKACTSARADAIHTWARQWFVHSEDTWVESEAHLRGVPVTEALRASIANLEVGRLEEKIRLSPLSKPAPQLSDAQHFIARGYGFENWLAFAAGIQALEQGDSPAARFEAAADAIVSGDMETLANLLGEHPELIAARSLRIHNAPLLHYVAANGIEGYRQKTPANILQITRLLLDSGADVNAESGAYGGGCTALGLAATSIHPDRAGVQDALLQLLLDRGALMDMPSIGGNRHTAVEACLANGRGDAAAFLASRGAPLDLATAAGAGRLDAVRTFFSEDGSLKPPATRLQLQRGFLFACLYGRLDVVRFLLDHGADLRDQADVRATGLHWAAGSAYLDIIQLLLERGAPLEEINAWGGTVLEHAGWALVNGDSHVDYIPVFELLLAAGAKIQDGWLAWLDKQEGRPAATKAQIAEVLRRYGAVT